MIDRTDTRHAVVTLDQSDAEALDTILASIHVTNSEIVGKDPSRLQKMTTLLNLLDAYPVPDASADLTRRTMDRIRTTQQEQRFAEQIESLTAPIPAFRWTELIAVAAVLMIGLSLLWPFLERNRADAQRIACTASMGRAGQGFAQYTADHDGVLPRRGSIPGHEWYHVGEKQDPSDPVRSNSAHLAVLINRRYVRPNALTCPGNRQAPTHLPANLHDWPNPDAISYSYQIQFSQPIRIDQSPKIAIIADRNPFITIRVHKFEFNPQQLPTDSRSRNHDERGQNVLKSDWSVQWTESPLLDEDNIYRVEGIETYSGTEIPISPSDSFLVP